MSNNIDDYLQQGIHGQKQTKPDERRKFLGTLRERIVIALTQSQVREKNIYLEVEDAIRKNKKAHLYLNGNMNYQEISKYKKIADKHSVAYTIVTNKEHNTNIGLALAYDYAIDKDEIYVKRKERVQKSAKNQKKGFLTLFSKAFKRRGR